MLHAGDLDKSGHMVKTALDEDLRAFIAGLGGEVEIKRIALTEAQVHAHKLAFTKVSAGLNAGNHGAGYTASIECQLEAMDISDIRKIVRQEFERHLDMDLLRARVGEDVGLRLVIERNHKP